MIKKGKYPHVGGKLVLESNAGFYIGRLWYESELESEPYDRLSTYYATRDIADKHLEENTYVEKLN